MGIILGIVRDALLVWLMLVPILLRLTGRADWWLHRLVRELRFGH
jgi:RND superfamily putative drug exporter